LDKKLRAARERLIACAKSECPDVLRRDCSRWLGEVDAALPSVVIAARSGSEEVTEVSVLVDGRALADSLTGTALTVDPGRHVFRFEHDGSAPLEQTLSIREGHKNRLIEVDFGGGADPAREKPEQSSVPVYGLAALGGIGIGSFVFFGLRAHSRKQDLEDCKGHCAQDDVNAVRRDQLVGDISLGIGLFALGAAAYLHFGANDERSPSEASWQLGVAARADGGTGSLIRRF